MREIISLFNTLFKEMNSHGTRMQSMDPDICFKKLKLNIESIGKQAVNRPAYKEIYIKQWNLFVADNIDLDRSAIRYLCWVPAVAMKKRFLNLIENTEIYLGPRSIQGLIRSFHVNWTEELARSQETKKIKDILLDYDGHNRTLNKWKNNHDLIVGVTGPKKFASELLLKPIEDTAKEWGLEESSAYLRNAVIISAAECRNIMLRDSKYGKYLIRVLLRWKGWELESYKAEIGSTILSQVTDSNEQIRNDTIDHVLSDTVRLGDPRLQSVKWIGIPEVAKAKFITWLCKDDITFFFDHVLPKNQDKHGRKQFWLSYLKHYKSSRPLLCRYDRDRLKAILTRDRVKVGLYGDVKGTNSVFLLDFGKLVVVEYSKVGACYFYTKEKFRELIPDFWMQDKLSEDAFKDRHLCIDRIRHIRTSLTDWRDEARRLLSIHGIRP